MAAVDSVKRMPQIEGPERQHLALDQGQANVDVTLYY